MKKRGTPAKGSSSFLPNIRQGRRLFDAHFGASPRTPLKELFEKSSLRNLKNFQAFSEIADVIRKHVRHMLASLFRHMCAVGH